MLNSTVTTTNIEYNHFGFVKHAMHEDFFVISSTVNRSCHGKNTAKIQQTARKKKNIKFKRRYLSDNVRWYTNVPLMVVNFIVGSLLRSFVETMAKRKHDYHGISNKYDTK